MEDQLKSQFDEPEFWSEAWVQHLQAYLRAPPRCGVWLRARFHLSGFSILEIAGGSCRDSRYLCSLGAKATGSDFDNRTIEFLKNHLVTEGFKVLREDAFAMSFEADEFDMVFHNGFWVLFSEDSRIAQLLKEQARVAKKWVIGLVHNAENRSLVRSFKEKSATDSLYDIRFFQRDEVRSLISLADLDVSRVSVEKFGGFVDRLYSLERLFPGATRFIRWLAPRLYRFQPWSRVERIAVIIELH